MTDLEVKNLIGDPKGNPTENTMSHLPAILDHLSKKVDITSVNAAVGTNDPTQAPSVDVTGPVDGVLDLTFNNIKGAKGDKGDQGNTGSSVDYSYELVNNVTTDDATKGLSAAQGVVLDGKISQLGQDVYGINNVIDGLLYTKNENTGILKFADGTISTTYQNHRTSDFIHIPTFAKYIEYHFLFLCAAPLCGLALYDGNKTFIAAVNSSTEKNGIVDLSSYPNAKYVRFSSDTQYPNNDGYIVFKKYSDAEIIKESVSNNIARIEAQNNVLNELLYKKQDIIGLLRRLNGKVDDTITTIRTSDFISIISGTAEIRYYNVFDNAGSYCGLALYDNNKNFISAVNSARTGALDLSQYPSAKYVRFSSAIQYPNNNGYIVLSNGQPGLDEKIEDVKYYSGTDNLPVYASANGVYDFYSDGKAWGVRNGVLVELAASKWARTELIPINRKMRATGISASSLLAYTSANGYFSLIFLGKKKEVISYYDDGITESHELNIVSLPVPADAVYFVANGVNNKAKISGTILSNLPSYSDVTRLENPPYTPLETIKKEVGFAAMFLEWGFIGDSLSSGEMDCYENGAHVSPPDCDFYEHSWGQYICKLCGTQGYNFSVGGQTAHGWINETGERGWGDGVVGASANPKLAYTIALGTNDKWRISESYPVGTSADVDLADYHNNANSFFGDYAGIIQRIRSIQPKAPIFVITTFKGLGTDEINNAIRQMPSLFDNVYLIDMNTYFINPYGTWKNGFVNVSHFSAAGYLMVAWATMNYIDMIVQNNPEKFLGQCLVGTDYELNP